MKLLLRLSKEALRYRYLYLVAILSTLSLTCVNLAAPRVLSRMTGIVSAGVDEAGLLQIRQLTMILVIESGEIRESGTHDELLKMNGIYARMDKIQNSAQEKGIQIHIRSLNGPAMRGLSYILRNSMRPG